MTINGYFVLILTQIVILDIGGYNDSYKNKNNKLMFWFLNKKSFVFETDLWSNKCFVIQILDNNLNCQIYNIV